MTAFEIPAYPRLTAHQVRDFTKEVEELQRRGFSMGCIQSEPDGPWSAVWVSPAPPPPAVAEIAESFVLNHAAMIVWWVPMFQDVSNAAESAQRIGDLYFMEHNRERWIAAEQTRG